MSEKNNPILIKGKVGIYWVKYHKDDFGIVTVIPKDMIVDDIYSNPIVDKYNSFCIKGKMPTMNKAYEYNITAKQINDDKWGIQYELMFISQDVDVSTEEKQKKYLEYILTPLQIDNLYNALPNPFKVIQEGDIQTLQLVKGIGVTTAIKMVKQFKKNIDYSTALIELGEIGVSQEMIAKMVDYYKSPDLLVKAFKKNPYILCQDINGIGFKKADTYAINSGISLSSDIRIKAYIMNYLNEEAYNGNSWILVRDLLFNLEKTIGTVDRFVIGNVIKDMVLNKQLWLADDKSRLGLMKLRNLETNILKEIIRLQKAKVNNNYDDWGKIVEIEENKYDIKYTDEQINGLKKALENNVICITGYGGTGKSSVVKLILAVLNSNNFAQTALSGKAANRLKEITGYDGYTIHRLLGATKDGTFTYNSNTPLENDVIIIDEASMIGGDLFYDLLCAIPTGAKLIILGDAGQLSSIGTCNVFHDLLTTNIIPSVTLTIIHRQAQKSKIVMESIKIRKQEQIFNKGYEGNTILGELQDLELDIYSNNDESDLYLIKQFNKHLKRVNNILDIQIIVPLKERGNISTFNINNKLQQIYNPNSSSFVTVEVSKDKSYELREGDKVINIQNDYELVNTQGITTAVFNGTMGIIIKINQAEKLMVIDFDTIGKVIVSKGSWKYIQLAYAISVHKSQGAEWNTVIVGVDYSAYTLLSCELLYTAITRAKKYCVLCGENKAIRYAISETKTPIKNTFLPELINEMK
jgi:exodeoxyribonuclease V alpha subunit